MAANRGRGGSHLSPTLSVAAQVARSEFEGFRWAPSTKFDKGRQPRSSAGSGQLRCSHETNAKEGEPSLFALSELSAANCHPMADLNRVFTLLVDISATDGPAVKEKSLPCE